MSYDQRVQELRLASPAGVKEPTTGIPFSEHEDHSLEDLPRPKRSSEKFSQKNHFILT